MSRRGRKQFDKEDNVYFVTTTVLEFTNIFTLGDKYFPILLDSLRYLLNKHKAVLMAYVFMPNHIHMVVHMPEGESVSNFMRDYKRHTSSKIKEQLLKENKDYLVKKLTEMSGTGSYKLWMDRFDCLVVRKEETLATKINYIHMNPVKAGLVADMSLWEYSSASKESLIDTSFTWEPLVPLSGNIPDRT